MANRADVSLVLRRAGFTPRPAEVDAAMAIDARSGLTGVVADVLAAGAPDPGVAATPPPELDDPGELLAELAAPDRPSRKAAIKRTRRQSFELAAWWIRRMTAAERPFPEKLAFFWHGHFATSVQKVRSPALMLAQQDLFRSKGLGRFDELVQAVAKDPAMMRWLDTDRSSVGDPNENFAREMLELFVLGHGQYSEADVREAARCFTGWRWRPQTGFHLAVRQHDDGTKTVLGDTGNLSGEDVVRLATSTPAASKWVASRVWSRFAAHAAPGDEAVTALLPSAPPRPLSELFAAVLLAPALTSPGVRGGLIKQPVEWVVGAQRALGATLPDALVLTTLRSLGQIPFAPASVGGWPEGTAWLSTSATAARVRFASSLATRGNISPLADQPSGARIEAVANLLAIDRWTNQTYRALSEATGSPARLVTLALISPEYQLA